MSRRSATSPRRPDLVRLASGHSYLLVPVLVAAVIFAGTLANIPRPPVLHDAYQGTMTAVRLIRQGTYAYGPWDPDVAVAPNASVTPGYPLFLAALYAPGHERTAAPAEVVIGRHPLVTVVQFAIALLLVAVVAQTGREMAGPRAGMLAGLLSAAYLPFAWASSVANPELLGAVLMAAVTLLAVRMTAEYGRRTIPLAVGLGLLFGATIMVRPALIGWGVAPLAYAVIVRTDPWRRTVVLGLAVVLGFALVFSPWWVRNYQLFDRFVPLRTGLVAPGASEPPAADPTALPSVPQYPPILAESTMRQVVTPDTPARQTAAAAVVGWVPPLGVIYEDVFHPDVQRIPFDPETPRWPSVLVTQELYTRWFHRLLLVLGVVGCGFIPRARRLALVAAVPLAVLIAHWNVEINVRYLFPMMPAVAVLAAVGVIGVLRTVRPDLFSPAGR